MENVITFFFSLLLGIALSLNIQAQEIDFENLAKVYKAATNVVAIRSADMDVDGIKDIVLVSVDTLHVLKGVGNGTFIHLSKTDIEGSAGGAAPYDFKIADFNNDGKPDVVYPNGSFLGLLINNGSGGFLTLKQYSLGGGSYEVAVADFDQDGYLDVVAPTSHFLDPHYKYIAIFINNKNGTLKNEVLYSVPAKAYDDPESITGFYVNALDMDDDGYPDVIQPYLGKDSIAVYYNKGDGTFNIPERLSIPSRVTTTQVMDMDHDNKQDLIMIGEKQPTVVNPDYTFGFYLQKSNDADQNIIRTYNNPYGGQLYDGNVVQDMNNDGEHDLTLIAEFYNASTDSFFDSLILYKNVGSVNFNTQVSLYSRAMPWLISLITDDFNGDNLQDYAFVSDDSSVYVMLQKQMTTSIESPSEKNLITIYPNPTSGIIHVKLSSGLNVQSVLIYDTMGRLLHTEKWDVMKEDQQIDLNNLYKGLYSLQFEMENGSRNVQHFVLE